MRSKHEDHEEWECGGWIQPPSTRQDLCDTLSEAGLTPATPSNS